MALTAHERDELLAGPHVAVLSVARDDGRPPLTVPVFYAYEPGGHLTFFTDTFGRKTRKVGLIERAGALSLCVQPPGPPYRFVTVEGTAVRADRPASPAQMLAIVGRYMPRDAAEGFVADEFANPESDPVVFTIRPDRWVSGSAG